jgi:glutamate racemase
VACGTVSTTALPALQRENDLPVLGVVDPACRRAAAKTRSKRVGLIATAASVHSGAYERTLHEIDPEIRVVSKACPLFVPLVENGRFHRGDVVIETVAREYLEPLRHEGIDTLILGCTHYPLLTEIIADIVGEGVELINVGQEAAWEMNLRIPEDISFCGYDGIPLTQAMSPRLTTIRQSSEDIGRTAARRLIELIEAPETASRKPTIFPVELVEGGTIGEV